jgi:WhiB family redox-sensing transcriptional regulator
MTSLDTRHSTQPLTERAAHAAPVPRTVMPDDFDVRGPIGDIDWTQFANCKGKTHLFFAPKAERPQARARREAKARSLCDKCVVAQTCKEFARVNHEYGLWGGESEEERHLAGFTIAAPVGLRGAKYRGMRDKNVATVSGVAASEVDIAEVAVDPATTGA